MAPKGPAKAAPAKPPAKAAPSKKDASPSKGKDDDGAAAPAATGATPHPSGAAAPKNKEEVLALVNLDGLPHCPNEQIIEILKERYETLVSVFIHYCKQSDCKTLEQATRLRLGVHCRSAPNYPADLCPFVDTALRRITKWHSGTYSDCML